MVTKDLEVGDLVWAKMKGFPAWPAKIVEPPASAKSPKQKKAQHYVYFFGSDNYAWILDDNIVPHAEHMLQISLKKKSAAFQSAVEAITNYSKTSVKKEKSTPKDEKEKIQNNSERSSSKGKATKVVNHFSIKRDGKVQEKRRLFTPKKVKVVKVQKRVARKRPSSGNEDYVSSHEFASSPPKFRKTINDEEYSALSASVPPNLGYSHVPQYDDDFYSHQSPGILARPAYVERPSTPNIDIETLTETLKAKHVEPTKKRIGFLGLGIMGRGIVKNLLNSGHHVTVWNRTPEKCNNFIKAGAEKGQTPADVVKASDITFCCVSDPDAAKSLVFGNCGVLKGLDESTKESNKGYVEMTAIDPETSLEIAEAINMKQGKYLEAPINGSKRQAEEGTLFILAAGDRNLFRDCETCFHAMGKHAYYISCEVGNGSKMNLILSMLLGTTYAALAEAMVLVERAKLSQNDFLEILELGGLNCPSLLDKGHAILTRDFSPNTPLKHAQKDINLALLMGNVFLQPMPVVSAANEVYKHSRLLGYSDHDVCAVYQGAKY